MEPVDAMAQPGGPGPGPPGTGVHPPRARRGPSTKPALVVVAVAAFLVVSFSIGGILTGGTPPKLPKVTVHRTTLPAAPATAALAPIERPGTPPHDVLGALVVPAGATRVSATPWDGLTEFSGSVLFSVPATQADVVQFFRAELAGRGWRVISTGPAHGHPLSTEVLAQRASSDGWYWEAGVVVQPTTFPQQASADRTRFTLELFVVPDAT